MIGTFFRLTALAAAAAVLAVAVRKQTPELSLALVIAACCVAGMLVLSFAEPLVDTVKALSEKAGLSANLAAALYKILGIGLLTGISADICLDAGQSALAKLIETGGGLVCVCLSLPLLQAVLELIEELL